MGHKRLSNLSTLPTKKIDKAKAASEVIRLITRLSEIQDKLYAQSKYAVLIVLQGMDTSGKDSAVKHVFSGVNPAGCNVKSFKVPGSEEASHHFLWRINKECPQKGMIKIFNRSHYEDILVPSINKTLSNDQIKERCREINEFERGLVNDNTILIKFFLNISHEEQLQRLEERMTDPDKNWKLTEEDSIDIDKHMSYSKVYENIFARCSEVEKWHIIPADKKWYKNYAILDHIVNTLEKFDIEYPAIK